MKMALFLMPIDLLIWCMHNTSFTYEFRQAAWRELSIRCAED